MIPPVANRSRPQLTYLLELDLASPRSDREALLAIQRKDVESHLATNVEGILENQGEPFVTVSNGRIQTLTREEIESFLTTYFRNAKYQEYTALEEPVVRISDDGTMAWVLSRTRAKRTQTTPEGTRDREFVYAGIMLFEKVGGKWMRVGNVSTFEP